MAEPESLTEPLERVRHSAREWHRLQLAALAFVGLCGVLKGDAGGGHPMWLQTTSGVLALAALAVAGMSVVLVATVAWPLTVAAGDAKRAAGRLRVGVYLTFAVVVLTALSTMAFWWPESGGGADRVEATGTGGTVCGSVVDSASGWIELDVDGEVVRIELGRLVSLRPVDSC